MSHGVTGSVRINAVIMGVAGHQHGVVTRAQLLERGVAEWGIDYRLECGLLTSVHRGVYSVRPLAGPLERPFAAVLAAGRESAVSHRTAAAVHELVPPLTRDAPVEVSTRRDVRIGAPGVRIHRVSRLDDDAARPRPTAPGSPRTCPTVPGPPRACPSAPGPPPGWAGSIVTL